MSVIRERALFSALPAEIANYRMSVRSSWNIQEYSFISETKAILFFKENWPMPTNVLKFRDYTGQEKD